jgi:solute carrier family 6 (neurotransmitter transporter, glycine) member 5/9
VLQLVDFYAATLVAFILAIGQLFAFCYIYGADRMFKDIHFMLGFYPNVFWKVCWRFITPGLMTLIVFYNFWNYEAPKDGNQDYPMIAHAVGWLLAGLSLIQVPIFAFYRIYNGEGDTLWEVSLLFIELLRVIKVSFITQRVKTSFMPTLSWGPRDPKINQKYQESLSL